MSEKTSTKNGTSNASSSLFNAAEAQETITAVREHYATNAHLFPGGTSWQFVRIADQLESAVEYIEHKVALAASNHTKVLELEAEVARLNTQIATMTALPLSRDNEPPIGTWVRDRFGGTSMRQGDGWGNPGVMPFGRWQAMWDARGPYEICGPWGAPAPTEPESEVKP